MRRSVRVVDAGQGRLGEAVGVAEVLARARQQLGGAARRPPRRRRCARRRRAVARARAPARPRSSALTVARTCSAPSRSPGSQRSGSLGPASPRVGARAAMPARNSREKEAMTGSGTPSAFSPAAVTAMLSAASGLPSVQGSAVVTRASSRRSHAAPALRVVDAEEDVGRVRVGVAVRAHDVALQVGEVDARRPWSPAQPLVERGLQLRGVHAPARCGRSRSRPRAGPARRAPARRWPAGRRRRRTRSWPGGRAGRPSARRPWAAAARRRSVPRSRVPRRASSSHSSSR